MIDYQTIRSILPQAAPFILIDKIIDFKKGKSLTAIKNITGNEWIFDDGALAGRGSIFPETLLIEAAAQAALVLYGLSEVSKQAKNTEFILCKIQAEFTENIDIGHQLSIYAYASKMLENKGYMDINLCTSTKRIGSVQIIYRMFSK